MDKAVPKPVRMVADCIAATIVVVLIGTQPANAQSQPCAAAPHREFDFWVGTWDVRQEILQADNSWIELPARSTVRKTAGGCALIEEWHGDVMFFWEGMDRTIPLSGLSVRAYDPQAELWRIWWLDSHRPDLGLPFEGRFDNGEGVFLRKTRGPNGTVMLTRIRFYDLTANSASWELAISRDAGASWSPLWRMQFRR